MQFETHRLGHTVSRVTDMDQAKPPDRRSRWADWAVWAGCTASLCFSIWVMRSQTTPPNFLARNGIVFFGIALVARATTNMIAPASRLKNWLRVVWWAGLALSLVSLYLRTLN